MLFLGVLSLCRALGERTYLLCLQLYDVVYACGYFVEEDGSALLGAFQLERLLGVVDEGTLDLTLEREEELLAVEVEDVYE